MMVAFGFPSLAIIRQDKQHPALHEERELRRLADLRLSPQTSWRVAPIIKHGDFQFAMLICSELTNISYRGIAGKIDAHLYQNGIKIQKYPMRWLNLLR